jgi:Mobilization protein NikA
MSIRTEVFALRITPEERQHLRALAERSGRTESDLVRLLVLRTNADEVSVGIPSPALPGANAPEREPTAA